jgi:hypothetical protein
LRAGGKFSQVVKNCHVTYQNVVEVFSIFLLKIEDADPIGKIVGDA